MNTLSLRTLKMRPISTYCIARLLLLVGDMCQLRLCFVISVVAQRSMSELPGPKKPLIGRLRWSLHCLVCNQGSGSPTTEPAEGRTAHAAAAITEAPSRLLWTG